MADEAAAYDEHPVVPDAYLDSSHGLIFVHECKWGDSTRVRKTQLPQGDGGWAVSQTTDGQLTVTPSIHCTACGLHGFFTAGAWQ